MAETVKQQLVSGVAYTALAKYSGIVLSLVVVGVLSRLLAPEDFGVMAIATVVIAFFNLFTDVGISTAIIQRKDLTDDDLEGIFAFTIWMGTVLSVAFFASSWAFASIYDSPVLGTLCRLLAANLFFASGTIVPGALFYRNKQFKYVAIRSLIIQVSTGALSVAAALLGAGLYALVITPILSSLLMFAISLQRYPQRLRLTSGVRPLRKIFGYSAYQFMFSVINYFSRNLDKLLVGKFMTLAQLGYYEKSYRLMMLPLQNITQVITPVMHPIFSDFQNDLQRLAYSYERIIRLFAFIGLPLGALMWFTAEESMILIFGPQWMPSVPVFRILTLTVGVQIITSSSGSIFQAAGDTRSLFVCGLFSSVFTVSGMLAGIFYFGTLEAVAWCICVAFALNMVQCYWQMYRHTLHRRPLMHFVRQLLSPLAATALVTAVLLPVGYFLDGENIFLTLGIKVIIFFTIFGLYIQLTKEYDLIGLVRNRIYKQTNERK